MPRHDDMEPIARAVGALVSDVHKQERFFRWGDYTMDEDLIPVPQTEDNLVQFTRAREPKAKMELFNIRPIGLEGLIFHPAVVTHSEKKYGAVIEIDNRTGIEQPPTALTREFARGETEMDSVSNSFSIRFQATLGTGQASAVKAEAELETTYMREWGRQTGLSRESKEGGQLLAVAPADTHMEARLEWTESDLIRHVEGFTTLDCGVRLGKHARSSSRGWRWRGTRRWSSLDHLIAVCERRGSVKFDLDQYFRHNLADSEALEVLKQRPRIRFDDWPEFQGESHLKVIYTVLADNRPDCEEFDGSLPN